jgi:hypothetical protein
MSTFGIIRFCPVCGRAALQMLESCPFCMVLYREENIRKNPEIQKKLTDYKKKNPVVADNGKKIRNNDERKTNPCKKKKCKSKVL